MEQTHVSRLFVPISLVIDLSVPELSVCLFQLPLEFVVSDAKVLAFSTELLVLSKEFLVAFHSILKLLNHGGADGSCDGRLSACLSDCHLQEMREQIDVGNHRGTVNGVLRTPEDGIDEKTLAKPGKQGRVWLYC